MQLYRFLLLIVASTTLFKFANGDAIPEIEERIISLSNEIERWIKTGEVSASFRYSLSSLTLPQNQDWRSFKGERSNTICIICQSALRVLMRFYKEGMSADEIKFNGIKICSMLKIASERVCDGAVTLNLPTILYIIDTKPSLNSSSICGVLLESQACPLVDEEFNWTIDIDENPPKPITEEKNNETINIVQITDLHYDPNYEISGHAYCGEPACCRKGQNDTNISGKVAGFWGDYGSCDTPWHAVIDVLDHINSTHKDISYIYFTGDIIDHGIWETTLEGNIKSINVTYREFYETFGNTPVYPILGNHEPQPLNLYAPISITNELSTQWLFDMIADLWYDLGWLPEHTRSTIRQGGYYTVSPKKGFRIIVINSNVCYAYNWWIWYQPKDPYNQLQWLADTLLQAEKDNEFVHILGHIPPASEECQSTWKREYLKVVDRFAHIIKAQFNGHTHNDEVELLYSSGENGKVNNVAWNGGSITTYTELNPNYKVYIVDSKNYAVKDYDNWIYNLTLANENMNDRPQWYKSYSFKEEYNISDLSYDSLGEWYSRLSHDDDLLTRYYKNFVKHADASLKKECNTKCMKTYMCRIIASLGKNCD